MFLLMILLDPESQMDMYASASWSNMSLEVLSNSDVADDTGVSLVPSNDAHTPHEVVDEVIMHSLVSFELQMTTKTSVGPGKTIHLEEMHPLMRTLLCL